METALATSGAIAFEDAVLPYYPGLVQRLTLIVGDPEEARDLAQSTYLRAQKGWSRFRGGDVRAWLYTIGIRLALNEVRRRRRLRNALRPSAPEPSALMTSDPDLWQAVQALERRHRIALVLHVLEGYSYAEIGELLKVSPGTVASWVFRTKAKLRAELGGFR